MEFTEQWGYGLVLPGGENQPGGSIQHGLQPADLTTTDADGNGVTIIQLTNNERPHQGQQSVTG